MKRAISIPEKERRSRSHGSSCEVWRRSQKLAPSRIDPRREKSPSRLCCMQQGDVHLHDSAQELQTRQRRECNRGYSAVPPHDCWFRELVPCNPCFVAATSERICRLRKAEGRDSCISVKPHKIVCKQRGRVLLFVTL